MDFAFKSLLCLLVYLEHDSAVNALGQKKPHGGIEVVESQLL